MIRNFKVWFQYCLPQHLLSRLAGKLANCKWSWLKNGFIKWFIRQFSVDLSFCEKKTAEEYATFNEFFTRRLIPSAFQISHPPHAILSPVSGTVCQCGIIEGQKILQAKGHFFNLESLLSSHTHSTDQLRGGHFASFYLSPRDYHRVHMPITGKLQEMIYIPGTLFSVNTVSTELIPNLFAKNERVVSLFETEVGPMAIVMVGALMVGSIETVWSNGPITPISHKEVRYWWYGPHPYSIPLTRGEEVGHFQMGSTVIVLFPPQKVKWDAVLQPGASVQVGQAIGMTI